MYQRPARILYLGQMNDPRTETATRLTDEIGAGWMEGRGVPVREVDAGTLAWADLVIPLDADMRRECPPLPVTARMKSWDLPADCTTQTEAIIREHVQAMLGGLRMLSRGDPAQIRD